MTTTKSSLITDGKLQALTMVTEKRKSLKDRAMETKNSDLNLNYRKNFAMALNKLAAARPKSSAGLKKKLETETKIRSTNTAAKSYSQLARE